MVRWSWCPLVVDGMQPWRLEPHWIFWPTARKNIRQRVSMGFINMLLSLGWLGHVGTCYRKPWIFTILNMGVFCNISHQPTLGLRGLVLCFTCCCWPRSCGAVSAISPSPKQGKSTAPQILSACRNTTTKWIVQLSKFLVETLRTWTYIDIRFLLVCWETKTLRIYHCSAFCSWTKKAN